MNVQKDWLAMLERATNYGDLQIAFARMNAEAESTGDSDAIVASIDEAIHRIEQERARDQAELDGFSSDYEAFKQQQSGVLGWFRRKLPFTETRKQELGHRDALNDQRAEILADNFIIARAQMLKERIASPNLRRLGQKPSYWQGKFQATDSVNSIAEFGRVVHELGTELSTAKRFVDAVAADINDFSAAKFVSKEDQLSLNADISAARNELKALSDELQAKVQLRGSALATLKSLLINELSEKDSEFRSTNLRLAHLKSFLDKQPRLVKLIEERLSNVNSLIAKMVETESIPGRVEKVESSIKSLKRDWDEADRRRLRAASELEGPSQLYHAALKESQQANAAVSATKPLYDAYMAEKNVPSANTAEVTSESDFEVSPSSVVAEYRKVELAANSAATLLSQRTPAFEQAKSNHDNAVKESKAISEKLDTHTSELKKIQALESELLQQILKAKQHLASTQPEFRIAVDAYLSEARQITWSDSTGAAVRVVQDLLSDEPNSVSLSSPFFAAQRPPLSSSDSSHMINMQQKSECLKKALQTIEKDQKALRIEQAKLSQLRKEAIQRRGQMLLDNSVLSELDLD